MVTVDDGQASTSASTGASAGASMSASMGVSAGASTSASTGASAGVSTASALPPPIVTTTNAFRGPARSNVSYETALDLSRGSSRVVNPLMQTNGSIGVSPLCPMPVWENRVRDLARGFHALGWHPDRVRAAMEPTFMVPQRIPTVRAFNGLRMPVVPRQPPTTTCTESSQRYENISSPECSESDYTIDEAPAPLQGWYQALAPSRHPPPQASSTPQCSRRDDGQRCRSNAMDTGHMQDHPRTAPPPHHYPQRSARGGFNTTHHQSQMAGMRGGMRGGRGGMRGRGGRGIRGGRGHRGGQFAGPPWRNFKRGPTCFSCGSEGHFQKFCPTRLARSQRGNRGAASNYGAIKNQNQFDRRPPPGAGGGGFGGKTGGPREFGPGSFGNIQVLFNA